MKNNVFVFFFLMLMVVFPLNAKAISYSYEINGTINYSNLGNSDPFISPGTSTFTLQGIWSDEGYSVTNCSIDGAAGISTNPNVGISFVQSPQSGSDGINIQQNFILPEYIASFHIAGWDETESWNPESDSFDIENLDSLDWYVYWIGIAPNGDNYSEYWEWGADITGVRFYAESEPVPEPATIFLFSLGLAGGMFIKKKRNVLQGC